MQSNCLCGEVEPLTMGGDALTDTEALYDVV
jgi:hypothetical protein